MPKRKKTKKIQAKLDLLRAYEDENDRAADTLTLPGVKDWLKTIGDEDLNYLIAVYVSAQADLDAYMDKIKEEVMPFLPDDSEF